jgi:hypothetical protein
MVKLWSVIASVMLGVLIALGTTTTGQNSALSRAQRDAQVGRAFEVPYRLTNTNHFLVRVRINGKGPFNFLVDSGAPALYVATETAAKVRLKPGKDEFWTVVNQLELEGGAQLHGVKARVDDPFQLVGMNALGLPGASIDGILGFTILARFRLEIDPTRNVMTWTRLDHTPPDPPIPHRREGDANWAPAELHVMNALGPLAKGLAFFIGKQPEEECHLRGFLGLEWVEMRDEASGQSIIRISRVLEGSPAGKAGVEAGDYLIRARGQSVASLKSAYAALATLEPGKRVDLTLRRGSEKNKARELTVTVVAGEGL